MQSEMRQRQDRHWTDEDLLVRLYGLDPPEGLETAHLDSCQECNSRWLSLESRRRQVLTAPPVSEDRLRAQRQAVFARIEGPRRSAPLWGLIPAAATALLLVAGVALNERPLAPEPRQAAISASDRELLREIASMVNEETPRAADPIRGLFAEDAGMEVQ